MANSNTMTYVPTAEEVPYYNVLFSIADTQRGGSIGGAQAVQFFSRSKLPVEVLKNVWTIADQPTTNTLDRAKFAVAVRLIQLIQNGVKGQGTDLRAPEGVSLKPAFFEGIPLPPAQAPPQQQQMQQPPPPNQQIQQQPQPMDQQMQHQQQPTMPPRPPMQHQQPPGAHQDNRALTVQDPYMLTPTEQARYEELFPTYAQPDGFVYGKEAVELFSKSGVPQNNLAAIWKLVDEPVDNRLDKLEFAMAMHLIVCLSRKNLPMPPSLPISLKQLKSQRPQQSPQSPELSQQPTSPQAQGISSPQMQPQHGMLPPPQTQQGMDVPPPQMQPGSPKSQMQSPLQSIPSPQRSSMGGGMPPPPLQSWSAPAMEAGHVKNESIGGNTVMSQLSAPPPLPSGGASISDAFDGLDAIGSGPTDINSYLASAPPVQTVPSFDGANQREEAPVSAPAPSTVQQQEQPSQQVKPHFEMPPHMRSGPPPVGHSATSDSQDLEQLREALQKLQAENISLKAQMGHLAEEESVVSRQVSQTAVELSQLSSQLTQVRAQMLASKARLMEATAELNAAKERKGVIQDLIADVSSTKEAIDDATRGVEESLQQAKLKSTPPSLPQSNSAEGDFFSFDSSPPSAPAPAPARESPSPYESQHFTAPQESLQPMVHQDNFVQTVASQSSYEEATNGHHKRDSSGWFSGGIMGGEFGGTIGNTNTSAPLSLSAGVGNVLSPQAIEELKAKHRDAENVARDAEESRRQIVAQTDELRRLADEAEKNMREYSKETDDKKKKKGMFGSGRGKKKDEKHAVELAEDARTKRDAFLQAQSQLNDATSLANDTKAEVERLAKEIEDAEISVASAASMESAPQQNQPQPPSQPYYPPAESQPPQRQQYGGYSEDSSFGVMGGPSNSAYNPSVMGGGGFEIPTPSAAAYDLYENPFAS